MKPFDFFPNIVSLNEGVSPRELLNTIGIVYAILPDKPLSNGIIMADIGYSLSSLNNRFAGHCFGFSGMYSNADLAILKDTADTIYLKVLASGIKTKAEGLRYEGLYMAQFAYDTLPKHMRYGGLSDFIHMANGKSLYNSYYTAKNYINNTDYYDIVERHKYSIVNELIADIKRVKGDWDYNVAI